MISVALRITSRKISGAGVKADGYTVVAAPVSDAYLLPVSFSFSLFFFFPP